MIQSIGPRVICKPQGDYNPAKEYVPLDMVRYHDQNFIARTKVPVNQAPTDGVDNNYWAFWGAYSQEVADLRQDVLDLGDYVGRNLKKAEMRFVKNSYDLSNINGNCSILKSESGTVYMFDLSYDFNLTNIVDSLNDLSVEHVDVIIISHYHADHANTANLNSLHNMGFVDERTLIYTPRIPSGAAWTAGLQTIYDDFMNAVNTIGCAVLVPDSNTLIEDENVKISFFNCSASDFAYYDALTPTADYNAYSMCNYIEYFNLRVGIFSDILGTSKRRIVNLGLVKHCQIITSAHHGSSAYYVGFDDVVRPDYVVIMAAADYLFKNSLNNEDVDYYASIDSKLMPTNNSAVELNANSLFFTMYNGDLEYHPAALANYDIYVDGNYINEQEGTQDKPFTDIYKALANARAFKNGIIRIYFSNYTLTENVNIIDLPNVVEFHGLIASGLMRFDRSKVRFIDCSFTGTNGVRLDQSEAYFSDCIFDSGTLEGYGIWARGSMVYAGTITCNYKNTPISAVQGSVINIDTLDGANNYMIVHLDDSNSQVYVGTSTISATRVFSYNSHCNVNRVLFDDVDLSPYFTAAAAGTLNATISNGQVTITGDLYPLTLTGLNTDIITGLPEQLRPAHDIYIPVLPVDGGYTSGTWYTAFIHVLPNGKIEFTCKDYASVSHSFVGASWTSGLR